MRISISCLIAVALLIIPFAFVRAESSAALLFPDSPDASTATWYGAVVQLDTIGEATVVFSNVTRTHNAVLQRVPLDPAFLDAYPGAPERNANAHPGADEGKDDELKNCRTIRFALNSGDMISANAEMISDARCLARIAATSATVTCDVQVIDAATGSVVMPLYRVVLGNGAPEFPANSVPASVRYVGRGIDSACVALRVRIDNIDASLVGIEGLVQYGNASDASGAEKRVARNAGAMPSAAMALVPNFTGEWTQIRYTLPADGHSRIGVYDILGRCVAVPYDGQDEAGAHAIGFNARDLAAGMYHVVVTIDGNQIGAEQIVITR